MKTNHRISLLVTGLLFGTGLVTVLFLLSENIIHYHNNFTRRYPQHAADERYKIDLKYNSYYFAGSGADKIYLGNRTAPFLITEFDIKTKASKTYKVTLKNTNLKFRAPRIKIFGEDFFVFEGAAPYVYKGKISNWKATLRISSGAQFSAAESIDSLQMVVRRRSPATGENILGLLNLNDSLNIKQNRQLLQKQIDGFFDTDGTLNYNEELSKIVYVYYYRNQYIVADKNLKLQYRGNTIDTISTAQLEIAKIEKTGERKLSKPGLLVNKNSAVYGNYLYVQSMLPGKYDPETMWKRASTIDVYDLTNKTYQSSFYVYNINEKQTRSFIIKDNFFYALISDKLVCYELRDNLIHKK